MQKCFKSRPPRPRSARPPLLVKEGNVATKSYNSFLAPPIPVIYECAQSPKEAQMRKLLLTVVTLAVLCEPVHALAQVVNATLFGTVSDASGALIPGVPITARNTDTGIVSTTISGDAGT